MAQPASGDGQVEQSSEIYTYEAPHNVYAMNWSVRPDKKFRLAVASFLDQPENNIEIVTLDDETGEFHANPKLTFSHPYPPNKLAFVPDRDGSRPDLVATSGDFLRIFRVNEEDVVLEKLLNNHKSSEYCSPLTSFDWNEADIKRLGTSSIDTTCTIWDIEKGVVDTQLIAHDKEVFDIAWGGVGVFATVSADGSMRVFDLRDRDHSTIIYEASEEGIPLLRLGWNRADPRYLATFQMDSQRVIILDIRYPTYPVNELTRHSAAVNALAWAPHSGSHLCTAGDDAQALIWDLNSSTQPQELDPILAYNAGAEVHQLQWCSSHHDWVAICFANKLQILRV